MGQSGHPRPNKARLMCTLLEHIMIKSLRYSSRIWVVGIQFIDGGIQVSSLEDPSNIVGFLLGFEFDDPPKFIEVWLLNYNDDWSLVSPRVYSAINDEIYQGSVWDYNHKYGKYLDELRKVAKSQIERSVSESGFEVT